MFIAAAKVRTTPSGLESISYSGSRLWQKLPYKRKGLKNLSILKQIRKVAKVKIVTAGYVGIMMHKWTF